MSKALTPRQQAALDKVRSQGNTAGIDKGMIRALANKGWIDAALLPQAPKKSLNTRAPRTEAAITLQAQRQACLDRVEEAFQQAEAHYGQEFERAHISFSNNQKKTGGSASWVWAWTDVPTKMKIKLSDPILRLNGQQFIKEVPGHEAAHLIAVQRYGKAGRGHGARWQEVMSVIGQSANRCHSMETAPTTKGKVYTYKATCGTIVELKRGRHSRIMTKGASYSLRSTGGEINKACFVSEKVA